jgi:hypothetical protein
MEFKDKWGYGKRKQGKRKGGMRGENRDKDRHRDRSRGIESKINVK